jgi:hypothetical protein
MTNFGAVLQGWARPQLLPMQSDGKGGYEHIKPFGENGITARIWHIAYLWSMSQAFRRRQFWRFGHVYLAPVFTFTNGATETGWLVEVLRVLDKPRTRVRGQERENLTVPLCHDWFQASTIPTIEEKADEQKKYDELMVTYKAADLEQIRNRHVFHLDLVEHQQAPRPTGDIEQLTPQLVAWFCVVAPLHHKRFNMADHIKTVQNRGRITARHHRRMMMTYYRAELGRPTRRRMDPKHLEYFPLMRERPAPSERDF